MARNLARITNWYSKRAAWADWHDAAVRAIAAGKQDIVNNVTPPASAGHARIDRATKKLCELAGIELPKELQPL